MIHKILSSFSFTACLLACKGPRIATEEQGPFLQMRASRGVRAAAAAAAAAESRLQATAMRRAKRGLERNCTDGDFNDKSFEIVPKSCDLFPVSYMTPGTRGNQFFATPGLEYRLYGTKL
jgi:hypothetical protein